MIMIKVENISKSYDKKLILSSFDLQVQTGECLAVVGANGAGKSTLLNGLLGLLDFDEGEVLINGYNYPEYNNRIRKITGCIPEKSFLIEEISGIDFLYFHATLLGVNRKEIKKRALELTHIFFDDPQAIYKPVSSFSYGMKKRLEICASLIHKPEILIYDEPFNGLDPVFCKQFIDIINKLKDNNKTFIISSHDLDYVKEVSTHILMIAEGKTAFYGAKEEFFKLNQSTLDAFFEYLPKQSYDEKKIQLPEWLDTV